MTLYQSIHNIVSITQKKPHNNGSYKASKLIIENKKGEIVEITLFTNDDIKNLEIKKAKD